MLYFCTENERNLFSIENRPVGFYTECLLIAERVRFCILVNQWTHPPGQRITSVDDGNTQNYGIALFTLVGVTVLAFVALIAVWCLLRRRPGKTMGKITIPKKENTES